MPVPLPPTMNDSYSSPYAAFSGMDTSLAPWIQRAHYDLSRTYQALSTRAKGDGPNSF